LAYGTTATVARRVGAGDEKAAAEHGVAGIWLALGLGVAVAAVGIIFSGPIVTAMGASTRVAPFARTYLRISMVGAPFVLLALAGTGYLRGLQDTRTPLYIALAANGLNLALEVVLVYGIHLGIAGSAWGTVVAQVAAALAYLAIVRRNVHRSRARIRPDARQLREAGTVGAYLTVRTGSLLVAFTAATAIASRIGDAQVAAHQVAFQLWMLLALCLDAIAIAGQAIVGRALGASDPELTRATSRRLLQFGVVAGAVLGLIVVVFDPILAVVFTRDPAVRAELRPVLVAAALMQPIGGAVFVLDGILIGAGDVRYLAIAMAAATLCFVPCAIAVLVTGSGLIALWGSLYVFMLARLYGMGRRYRGNDWLVTGTGGT
jgi:putative MATE family efflux protein